LKKLNWIQVLLCVGLFAAVGCGAEEDGEVVADNNGAVNNGANNGAVNNGEGNNGANNGANNGNNGATNNGGANNGAVNNGAVNNGDANNGAVNNGAANNGAANNGDAGGLCPPQGPFGDAVGSVAPDVEFPDCDGQMHSLHDLCAHKVSWIFEFAAWCPPCRAFLPTVNDLYLSFDREDLGAFVVISQDNNFDAPDAAFCQSVKRQYNLTDVTVLYDPDGRLQDALKVRSNDINILMRQGGEIFFKEQYASDEVRGAIEAELSAQ
jgi:peroxiredoxin